MKPYFAKYLPVEGEFEEGKTCWSVNNCTVMYTKQVPQNRFKSPAKLFLCSRDVQVGDKCNYRGFKGTVSKSVHGKQIWDLWDGTGNHLIYIEDLYALYKVIGEILTPGIVEGQEFTEREMEFLTIGK